MCPGERNNARVARRSARIEEERARARPSGTASAWEADQSCRRTSTQNSTSTVRGTAANPEKSTASMGAQRTVELAEACKGMLRLPSGAATGH